MSSTFAPSSQGRPRKTDYFATFLNALDTTATLAHPAPVGLLALIQTLRNFGMVATHASVGPAAGSAPSQAAPSRC